MRSEERSGIIALTILLLWGTLLTEPLRFFTQILSGGVLKVLGSIGIATDGKLAAVIVGLVMTVICVLLLLLSKTKASDYYACIISGLMVIYFGVDSIIKCEINVKTLLTVGIALVISFIMLIFPKESFTLWTGDFFAFTLGVIVLVSYILMPLYSIGPNFKKVLFVCSEKYYNPMTAFEGFLTLPAWCWGIFLGILFCLPVNYFAFGRRKG